MGSVFASLLAWIVIGNDHIYDSFHGQVGSLELNGWRVYLMLCTFPALSSGLFMIFLPESPSYLYDVSQRRGGMEGVSNMTSTQTNFNILHYIFSSCLPLQKGKLKKSSTVVKHIEYINNYCRRNRRAGSTLQRDLDTGATSQKATWIIVVHSCNVTEYYQGAIHTEILTADGCVIDYMVHSLIWVS